MLRITTALSLSFALSLLVGCGAAPTDDDRGGQAEGQAVAAIAIGDTSTCTLSAHGAVECDGRAVGIDDAIAISVGHDHTCAVRRSGKVACFGGNEHGQLGDGTVVAHDQPVDVDGLSDIVGVTAGFSRTCAWTSTGDALCWGSSEFDPHKSAVAPRDQVKPISISIAHVKSISLGGFHACALIEGGTIQCWGANYFGQLGDGTEQAHDSPAPAHIANATQVAAGTHHTCAILADGDVQCWGADIVGQLGQGNVGQPGRHVVEPTKLPDLKRARNIVAASDHTCVLLEGRTAPRCWGYNDVGQVSPGKPYVVRPATIPTGIDDVAVIGSGANRTCAARVDGSVKCWGTN